ncbi:MAG: amidohydrolase [Treponemataceae bacterium]
MRVYEGTVLVGDEAGKTANFLVENRGRIVHVGDTLPQEYGAAPRTTLGAKALIPALADTHLHFMSHALFVSGLDVRAAVTIAELKETVREFTARRKEKIIIGFGASAYGVAERRLPDRTDLDEAAGERPIFIVKYDGHAAIANSAMLKRLPARIALLRGYDGNTGRLNQEAFFAATDFVTGSVPLPSVLRSMLRAADDMASRGIGMIHSVTGVGFPLDLDVTLESIFARGLRNELPYRVFFQTMDVKKAERRALPRIGGCFATALDGCFGSEDAALIEPYSNNTSNRGVLFYSDEQVRDFTFAANRAGLQIQMHAIGDAAFDQAARALDAALTDFPRVDHRHTIIHACLTTERGLDLCAERGIFLAVQPAFLHWSLEPLEYLESILGDRAYRISPLKTMLKRGIVMTGGSDAPCTLPDPLAGIAAACNHYVKSESLSFTEALALFTRNATRGSFDDADRGTLEVGKIADMTVLNENPSALKSSELGRLSAEGLFLSGKPYRGGQSLPDLLARGILNRRRKI